VIDLTATDGTKLKATFFPVAKPALGGKACRSADERNQHEETEVATLHESLPGADL